MSSYQEIKDYFKGSPNSESDYYGNPNYLKNLPTGFTYEDVTLEDLGFTKDRVLFELKGISFDDLTNSNTGEEYTDEEFAILIQEAVSQVEKELDIVIRPRLVNDRKDFYQNNVQDWMYTRVDARPILHVNQLKLYFNSQTILDYPDDWIKVSNRVGQLQIQPSLWMQGQPLLNQDAMLPAYPIGMPYITSKDNAPQMIGVSYVAGMLPRLKGQEGIDRDYYVPQSLLSYVAKYAAIFILERFGRAILTPGIAGYGVTMDGVSSNIQTTASAENSATSGEIHNLQEDMAPLKKALISYYGGNNIGIIA